jgi:RNA polymerase sigma-70 factor, ECF subfamily
MPDRKADVGTGLEEDGANMTTAVSPEERFSALHRANARPLLGFALRRAARPEDAADVVAETMLVAWRRIDEAPDGAGARLWLYGVARRVLANNRRGLRRRDRLGERLRRDVQRLVVPDVALGVTAAAELRRALAALSADDREVLQLAAWEGLGPQEIATVLEASPVAVRSRLHRARARLRDELDRHDLPHRPPAGHEHPDERPLVRKTEDDR